MNIKRLSILLLLLIFTTNVYAERLRTYPTRRASKIKIEDEGGYYDGIDNVEDALQALATGDVVSTAIFDVVDILDMLTVNTDNLVVNATGYEDKVGIGTAAPGSKLDVTGTAKISVAVNTPRINDVGGNVQFLLTSAFIDMQRGLDTNGNWISGDGDSEGISIDTSGNIKAINDAWFRADDNAGTDTVNMHKIDVSDQMPFGAKQIGDINKGLVGHWSLAEEDEVHATTDLVSGWDFTSGWTARSATINSATQFTTSGTNGDCYKDTNILTTGKRYRAIISGSCTTGSMYLYKKSLGGAYISLGSSFTNVTGAFTATEAGFTFLNAGASGAVCVITKFELYEVETADLTPYGNNGTLYQFAGTGYTTDQHGQSNRAYDFDGADTKIDTGDDMIDTGADSISAWIYAEGWGESNGMIITNGETFIITESAGRIGFTSSITSIVYSANSSVSLDTWYHIVVTRTSAGTTNIYINGVLSGSADQFSGTPTAGATNVFIGNNSAGTRTFDGSISDVKIYNRILSTTEITQLYEQYNPTIQATLVAEEDAGQITLFNMPVSATPDDGDEMSATFKIDNENAFKVKASADGAGGVDELQVIVAPTVQDDASHPSLAFGDGNTGLFERADNDLIVTTAGSARFRFTGNAFKSWATSGALLENLAATATNPVHAFESDEDTGIGRAGADTLSLIAGGVEGIRVTETGTTTTTTIKSNGANTVAIATIENTAGDYQTFRTDATPEGSVTGSIGDLAIDSTNGFKYIKHSGSATNTGWVISGGIPTFKSFSLADTGNLGIHYLAGYYETNAADATLTIDGVVTQTFGTVGEMKSAHAFVVAEGAGGTDLVLTVTGISLGDDGTRNDSDTEIIVADTDQASTNQYFETTKKWVGQITYTLTGTAGAFTFNYGFAKYEDFGNRDCVLTDFEGVMHFKGNETGLDIQLLHHKATGWTYSAAGFVPGTGALLSSLTDNSATNDNVATGKYSSYKRAGLSTDINSSGSEGVIIKVVIAVNNSIRHGDFHIGANIR